MLTENCSHECCKCDKPKAFNDDHECAKVRQPRLTSMDLFWTIITAPTSCLLHQHVPCKAAALQEAARPQPPPVTKMLPCH